ncbi:MAG: NAD(P)H-dependent oxidoreductase [Pseudomonadota bacterium]
MTSKRIFVLNGHPAEVSLTGALVAAYAQAARDAGHDVRMAQLHDLDFDLDHEFGGYSRTKPLEPDLEAVLTDIEWSDHVVLAAPLWWGGVPAKLKGLFDRALLPGRAFDTRKTTAFGLPAPMLGGRTGRIILTADTPGWFLRLVYRSAVVRQLRDQVLGFVGIRPARLSYFAGASQPKPTVVERWLRQVRRAGAAAA